MQVINIDHAFYDVITSESHCIDEVPESDYKGIFTGYKVFDTRNLHEILPADYCKVWRCNMTWSDMSGVIDKGDLREATLIKKVIEVWQ